MLGACLAGAAPRDSFAQNLSGGALADSSIHIPVVTGLDGARSDDAIFADICGCLSGRVNIRRDAVDFVPVAWTVRAMNGTLVRPRAEERSESRVTLDLSAFQAGIYIVSLRDQYGKVITRPLNVK